MGSIDSAFIAALVIMLQVGMSSRSVGGNKQKANVYSQAFMVHFMELSESGGQRHLPYQKVFTICSINCVLDVISIMTIENDASNSVACRKCDRGLRIVTNFPL